MYSRQMVQILHSLKDIFIVTVRTFNHYVRNLFSIAFSIRVSSSLFLELSGHPVTEK
jgi:hypothetical protein